ncbi:hypothetical protein C8F01DRAFT_1242520 [Mycena amicta]|nr:hypothetical protein C8F01DRAFT_1242520 [Mycena amicta]
MLDNPVLVAPRPVRLSSLLTTSRNRISAPDHTRAGGDENTDISGLEPLDKEISAQRTSPRSVRSLPTEALEEFLSILRPSFSPVLFTRRAGAVSFQHERSYSLKSRGLLKNDLVEELEVSRSTQPSRNMQTPDNVDEDLENILPVRWFTSNVLSSPISRIHTRNPFNRHILASPGPVSPITLSPAAIPLPLPTPEELILLEVS